MSTVMLKDWSTGLWTSCKVMQNVTYKSLKMHLTYNADTEKEEENSTNHSCWTWLMAFNSMIWKVLFPSDFSSKKWSSVSLSSAYCYTLKCSTHSIVQRFSISRYSRLREPSTFFLTIRSWSPPYVAVIGVSFPHKNEGQLQKCPRDHSPKQEDASAARREEEEKSAHTNPLPAAMDSWLTQTSYLGSVYRSHASTWRDPIK